jgi:hypothetical protein
MFFFLFVLFVLFVVMSARKWITGMFYLGGFMATAVILTKFMTPSDHQIEVRSI